MSVTRLNVTKSAHTDVMPFQHMYGVYTFLLSVKVESKLV